jgi:hypothetical protein
MLIAIEPHACHLASRYFLTSPARSRSLAADRPRSTALGLPLAPPPLVRGRIMLRFHRCLRVHPPPPPLPAVCRQSTAFSLGPKRSFPPTRVRAQNSPRGAAVIPAVSGELQRGQVDDDGYGEDLGEALDKTRQLVECAMFAALAGLAYFLSNSLAIEVCFLRQCSMRNCVLVNCGDDSTV